jgi:hypothetical protein
MKTVAAQPMEIVQIDCLPDEIDQLFDRLTRVVVNVPARNITVILPELNKDGLPIPARGSHNRPLILCADLRIDHLRLLW